MPRQLAVVALVAGLLLTGCASERASDPAPGPAATRAAEPAWARAPARRGEIVVRAEASPRTHGPFELRGRYTARFAQFAPEDPALDFSQQTSFVAALDRRPQAPGAGSVRLFRAARSGGERRVRLRGRYYLDVEFGDFPYVIRLTPAR